MRVRRPFPGRLTGAFQSLKVQPTANNADATAQPPRNPHTTPEQTSPTPHVSPCEGLAPLLPPPCPVAHSADVSFPVLSAELAKRASQSAAGRACRAPAAPPLVLQRHGRGSDRDARLAEAAQVGPRQNRSQAAGPPPTTPCRRVTPETFLGCPPPTTLGQCGPGPFRPLPTVGTEAGAACGRRDRRNKVAGEDRALKNGS